MTTRVMSEMSETASLSELLRSYQKAQESINKVMEEVDAIYRTSAVGQHPPIYDKKIEEAFLIMLRERNPLWKELMHKIVPGSRFRSFAQEYGWNPISQVSPSYSDILLIIGKYKSPQPKGGE